MAQVKITANIQKRELLKKFNQLISEKFEARFYDLIAWRIAFMLSIKSGIGYDELKSTFTSDGVGHQNISQDVASVADDETRLLFINLLCIVHKRKIDTKEEFPELLKLHCRHGFDILEDAIDGIGVNDNIVDFFINQLEVPKDVLKTSANSEIIGTDLINKIKKALLEMKAPLKFIEQKTFDRVDKLYFDIEDINYVSTNKLYGSNFILQLGTAIGLLDKIYLEKTKRERTVSINILKSTLPVYLNEFASEMNNNDLSFIVGLDNEDNILKADLKELPHLLVAGTTGSGKTAFLHSLIYQFISKHVDLYLIDGKSGFEFGKYSDEAKVVIENEDIVPTLKNIIEEMESRFSSGDIASKKPIVVIVDEFVDLIMQKSMVEDLFVRLAQKGRQTKIHIILATQRPDAQVMKGVLRSNIPSRIAFKVQKSTESKIILDETGAEELFGKGDMLFSNGKEMKRLQGFLVK